ncbi:laccase [Xylaria cf. heliscus]|nr:laccase [Xylaria cf. heliscus]
MALVFLCLFGLLVGTVPLSHNHNPTCWKALLSKGILFTNLKYVRAIDSVIREYEFNVTRGTISPDGFNKSGLLVNGQFPGPLIKANYGDTFRITVNNHIRNPEEGTAFHWHGILQKETPLYDGVAAVTQCPIPPGKSMTYTFKADSIGTTFYHAHYSSQYIDGLFGPLVILGPITVPYDVDLGPILLTDHFHDTYYQNLALVEEVPAQVPYSNNNLINGSVSCTMKRNHRSNLNASIFHFETGKVHKLSIVNAGAEALQRFSIDNHRLLVISNDFVPIEPYETNVLTLGVGQRADILVNATSPSTDAVWMRSYISELCAATLQPYALAIIYYPEAQKHSIPSTTSHTIEDTNCTNDPLSKSIPLESRAPPSASVSTVLTTTVGVNSTGHTLFYVNNSSFKGDYNRPIPLELANTSQSTPFLESPPKEYNIYDYGNTRAVRIIIMNPDPPSHPMHLHGHEFFILAEGVGTWDGTITNAHNPTRKDTHMIPGGKPDMPAYLVIEFLANNAAAWAFHCHIEWHIGLGLYINILDRPEAVRNMQFPDDAAQTCADWQAWTNTHNVAQGDSGP